MSERLIFWLSFLIPGSGHALLKRWKSALVALVYDVLAVLCLIKFIIPYTALAFFRQTSGEYAGALTIGREGMKDDSFLILVGFVFALLLFLVFLVINYAFARDAKTCAIAIKDGEEILSYKEKAKVLAPNAVPQIIAAPGFILIFLFMIVPAIVSIAIAFTNYKKPILPPAFLISWEGTANFAKLFTDPRMSAAFKDTLIWTIIWTFGATILTIVLGTLIALITNNKHVKGKKLFRTIYLLPWAVPAFLTILIFQIFFSKVGTMNTIVMPFITGTPYSTANAIGFLMEPSIAKVVIILVQAWLGFPYIYVLITGVLQTISDDLYEAASIDGGNAWSNFWDITFPTIMASAGPTLITQFTFNFNNITIIYLLSRSVVKDVGAVYGPLETVASLGYQLTMQAQYSTAAVFTLVTSVLAGVVVLFAWMKTGAFTKEDVM